MLDNLENSNFESKGLGFWMDTKTTPTKPRAPLSIGITPSSVQHHGPSSSFWAWSVCLVLPAVFEPWSLDTTRSASQHRQKLKPCCQKRIEMNFLLKVDLVSRCSNEPFWSFAHKGVRKTSVSEVNQSGPCPWCWASAHPGCDTCARSEWNPVRSHFAWHRLPSTPGAAALHVGFWGRSAYFSNILHKACSGCLIFRYAFFGSCPSMSHPKRHPRYHTWTSLQHPLQPIGDVTSNKSLKRESNVWINDLAWENG